MPATDSASPPRTLDHLLRQLRGHLRTRNLPRPDRLVLSTPSRSAAAEFTTGPDADRLAALLLWTVTLQGVSIGWTHTRPGVLAVAATGRTPAGLTIGVTTTAQVTALGGRLRHRPGNDVVAEFAGFRLGLHDAELVTYDELARVVTTARTKAAAGVVAA
jgi:hypothetical protein